MSEQATNVVWDCPHCTSLNRTPKSQDVVCGVCGEYSLYSDVLHRTDDVTGYFNEVESRFSAKHKKTAYELLPEKEQLVTSLFVAQFENAVPINEAVENIYNGIEVELQKTHYTEQKWLVPVHLFFTEDELRGKVVIDTSNVLLRSNELVIDGIAKCQETADEIDFQTNKVAIANADGLENKVYYRTLTQVECILKLTEAEMFLGFNLFDVINRNHDKTLTVSGSFNVKPENNFFTKNGEISTHVDTQVVLVDTPPIKLDAPLTNPTQGLTFEDIKEALKDAVFEMENGDVINGEDFPLGIVEDVDWSELNPDSALDTLMDKLCCYTSYCVDAASITITYGGIITGEELANSCDGEQYVATQIRGKIRDYIESKTDEHALDSGIDYQVGDLLSVIDTLLTKLTVPQLLELTKDEDFLESCVNFDRDGLTEAIKCDA